MLTKFLKWQAWRRFLRNATATHARTLAANRAPREADLQAKLTEKALREDLNRELHRIFEKVWKGELHTSWHLGNLRPETIASLEGLGYVYETAEKQWHDPFRGLPHTAEGYRILWK